MTSGFTLLIDSLSKRIFDTSNQLSFIVLKIALASKCEGLVSITIKFHALKHQKTLTKLLS